MGMRNLIAALGVSVALASNASARSRNSSGVFSVRKSVSKKKVDPIVAETHGWAELKQNSSTSTDPFVSESESLTQAGSDERYEPEIVRLEDSSKGSFWGKFSKAVKRSSTMRVDLDQ